MRKRILVAALVLTAGWSLILLLMDLLTTGEPVVGPGPILKADVVVIARRQRADSDRIEVERAYKGDLESGVILRVVNLADVQGPEAGQPGIYALSRFFQDYEVTRVEGQRPPLRVLSATPETVRQVRRILRGE
jgi:hypothetical protein